MQMALEQAQEAYDAGEVPVGCVFVLNNSVVGKGRNRTNETLNATAHAELVALREMSHILDQTSQMDLYVTVEPCIMCAAALRQVGIRQVFFGAGNDKFGGNGTVLEINKWYQLLNSKSLFNPYPSTGGILAKEAIFMLRKFYVRENENGTVLY